MMDAKLARIASRTFALYLMSWALLDCTYLPQYLLSLVHHLGESDLRDQNYWKNYYLLEVASLVLRVAGTALASAYFWNAGPRIMRLFLPAGEEATTREL
jgi:hypothetical protein